MLAGVIGALTTFIAVTSLFLWLARFRQVPAEARLERLKEIPRSGSLEAPFKKRVLTPILGRFGQLFINFLPQTFVARIGYQLRSAGNPMTTQAFFTIVLIFSTLLPTAFYILILIASQGSPPVITVPLILILVVMGAVMPFIWLRRRVRLRKLAIWKSLADAYDLLTVSVEAGLGLDAAFRQVGEKLRGPLADEITQMLREVGMGRPRREALEEMGERIEVPELVSFTNAVIQAEQLGTSLGRVLRAQAFALRTRRRQRAEEMARKAPVKMVFPLVFCIMPSFFIVVVGPIFIRLFNYLTG